MDLQLHSTVDDDEDRPPMKEIYALLEDFLTAQPEVSIASAARDLDALGSKLQIEEHAEPYVFIMRFWEVLVPLVYQLPYDHPSQERVVKLLSEFSSFDVAGNETSSNASKWRELPTGLDETLQDVWREPGQNADDPPNILEWTNLNSFTARLFGLGCFISESYRFPLWSLRYSFEGRGGAPLTIREMRVLVAAQWAIYAAPSLFALMKELDADPGRNAHPSDFSRDMSPMERWAYWKQRFVIDKSDQDYSEGVRSAASRAVQAMGSAEV